MQVEASGVVSHPPERVFEFLSDLRNHWRLDDSFVAVEAVDVDAQRGRVRLKGPLGISRLAATRVMSAEPVRPGAPGTMNGIAEMGSGTVGRVQWEVAPDSQGMSAVRLSATVERASLLDRILLVAGGAAWLRRLFQRSVSNLEHAVESVRRG
jgi:hypothetical protein